MAEETEGQDTGAEASGAGVDPAAVALALSGASREDAGAFLKKQSALIDDQRAFIVDQRHHLHEQFKNLRLNIWEKRLGVLLRIATGFVGLAVAAGLALMIWDAAHSNGLVIEEFSVPPDLASRGITGQVVASQMLDKLTAMQNETIATGETRQLTNSWDNNINVQIPDTGVSLSEVYRFLRGWLGHETHLSGEVYRTASGIAITARTGGDSGATFAGLETDLDSLIQKQAENIYGKTQPERYDAYLREHDRIAEAIPIMKALAESAATTLDRAIGYADWAIDAGVLYGPDAQTRLNERGAALGTDYPTVWISLGRIADQEGRPEEAARNLKKALSLVSSHGDEFYDANQAPLIREFVQGLIDDKKGEFKRSSGEYADVIRGRLKGLSGFPAYLAQAQVGEHELSMARTSLADGTETGTSPAATVRLSIRATMLFDSEAQNWGGVLSDANSFAPVLQKYPGERTFLPTMTVPLTAFAEAKLGKIVDAERHIAATPADCYDCLIARARIAELEGQHARADYWFARAVHDAPSIPFAYAYWGQALLERGDPDAAIAKFTIANQNGPKFADPLEGWGEALMANNRLDLALAKFEEAEKYAPNWGRLHLKWGEALGYDRKKDEAQKQFAVAAGLDLSAADKAELKRVSGHG